MSYMAELWVNPTRDLVQVVFDPTPMGAKAGKFEQDAPHGANSYSGFFDSAEDALADAERVVGKAVTFSGERDREHTIYRASLQ